MYDIKWNRENNMVKLNESAFNKGVDDTFGIHLYIIRIWRIIYKAIWY